MKALLCALALEVFTVATPALGQEPWIWQPEPGEIELFVGNIKFGKSQAAKVRTARVRRLLAWDPQNDEPELGSGRLTVAQAERVLEEHPELLVRGTVRLGVRPTAWSDEDLRAEFDRFCRLAWRIGRLAVKIDESGGIFGDGRPATPGLSKLMREGRHRELSLHFIGQRFPMVPVLARDNATRLVVFRHGYDDSAEVAKRVSSASAVVTADQVAGLKRFEFIEWTPVEGARIRAPLGHDKRRTT